MGRMHTNKPPMLVILSPGFPGDEQDSACLPAQQVFIRALNRNYPRLRVTVLSFEYPERRDCYRWFGNTVIPFNGWKKGWASKLHTSLAVWWRIAALQRENRVMGLLSFWCGPCALVGKYYARLRGLCHLIWILGQDARAGNILMPLIRPAAAELVALSNFLAAEFERNYGVRPLHIVPNGVDRSLYAVEPGTRDIDVLGVGSLTGLKRYDLFLDTIQSLCTNLPSIHGVICGEGPERERLLQRIGELGLTGRVSLAGGQAHGKALAMMQRSRVFLHPSSYEGFSTACLEALYAGAHVISFCDPMGVPVKNWHIVSDVDEMIDLARRLLLDQETVYEPVQLFLMDDNVRQMMELFGYREEAS